MSSRGPLSGLKVIECSTFAFGPLAGVMLGDMGAEVIKVESPVDPDAARSLRLIAGTDVSMPDGSSSMFDILNRNKRSIAIDLKQESGRDLLKQMVKQSDIFIQNFRPGVFEKIGLGYEDLSALNPQLIYAQTSGYGLKGEETQRPALDPAGQARSGMFYVSGEPGDPPNWISFAFADVVGASILAYGIVSAVAARERFGIGQRVDASHLQASMWLQIWGIGTCYYKNLVEFPRFDRATAANPLFNHYRCKDGEWITLGILKTDRDFESFCRALEVPHLVTDTRFANSEAREENSISLIELLDEQFAQQTREYWETRLGEEPDLIYDRVQRIGDLASDPAVLANGYLLDIDHPRYGPVKQVAPPVNLSKTPVEMQRLAPELGEHSLEILSEMGLEDEVIANLMATGVIG